MKAILVIDMPMMCCECKFFRFANNDDWKSTETICTINGKHCENGIDYKPRLCPLRPFLLGKELRKFRNTIKDKNTLIGFNMAVAICNKYFGENNESSISD